MQYIWMVVSVIAGFHAYTYGRWLKQNGNPKGAAGVFFLVAASIALPVYRILTAP